MMKLLMALLVSTAHPLYQHTDIVVKQQLLLTTQRNPSWEYVSNDPDVVSVEDEDGTLSIFAHMEGQAEVKVYEKKTHKIVWDTVFTVKREEK